MKQMKSSRLVLLGLVINSATLAPVAAAEWRFCIAPSSREHRIYMTAPFPTIATMEEMEASFHQLLERAGHPHDSVQCPTGGGGSEQAVRVMRQHADDFNRQMGNEIVSIDWRPPGSR